MRLTELASIGIFISAIGFLAFASSRVTPPQTMAPTKPQIRAPAIMVGTTGAAGRRRADAGKSVTTKRTARGLSSSSPPALPAPVALPVQAAPVAGSDRQGITATARMSSGRRHQDYGYGARPRHHRRYGRYGRYRRYDRRRTRAYLRRRYRHYAGRSSRRYDYDDPRYDDTRYDDTRYYASRSYRARYGDRRYGYLKRRRWWRRHRDGYETKAFWRGYRRGRAAAIRQARGAAGATGAANNALAGKTGAGKTGVPALPAAGGSTKAAGQTGKPDKPAPAAQLKAPPRRAAGHSVRVQPGSGHSCPPQCRSQRLDDNRAI